MHPLRAAEMHRSFTGLGRFQDDVSAAQDRVACCAMISHVAGADWLRKRCLFFPTRPRSWRRGKKALATGSAI
jgi:hypothetical protein